MGTEACVEVAVVACMSGKERGVDNLELSSESTIFTVSN